MDGMHYSSLQCFGIFSYSYYTSLLAPLEIIAEQNLFSNTFTNTFATHILDAKYEQANIRDVACNQHPLLLDQRRNLYNILSKHMKLFDGSLGVYPHKTSTLKSNLELNQCITALTQSLMSINKPLKGT